MALGADDVQSTGLGDPFAQLDIGAPASHVGGDGHGALLSCQDDNLRFPLMLLGIEHVVRNLAPFEHARQGFRNLH